MTSWIKRNIEDLKTYSLKDWLETVAGFLILVFFALLLTLVWTESAIFLKVMLTDLVMVVVLGLIIKTLT